MRIIHACFVDHLLRARAHKADFWCPQPLTRNLAAGGLQVYNLACFCLAPSTWYLSKQSSRIQTAFPSMCLVAFRFLPSCFGQSPRGWSGGLHCARWYNRDNHWWDMSETLQFQDILWLSSHETGVSVTLWFGVVRVPSRTHPQSLRTPCHIAINIIRFLPWRRRTMPHTAPHSLS